MYHPPDFFTSNCIRLTTININNQTITITIKHTEDSLTEKPDENSNLGSPQKRNRIK
ncbi:16006_t:CDS:2, partial [Racocetra fulgida]